MNMKTSIGTRGAIFWLCCLITIIAASIIGVHPAEAYYKEAQVFHPHPDPDGRQPFPVKHVGPLGIGVEFVSNPPFRMRITRVDAGTPAAATGLLQRGNMVDRVNGKPFRDIDPRMIVANAITEAEATDGKIVFHVQDVGDVTIKLPVLGRYSPTWPVNCPKSDNIVRTLAEAMAQRDRPQWGEVLFLLSTGEEQDLDVVRRWMQDLKDIGPLQWDKGYRGIGLAEYYLRTGDASVLPIIEEAVDVLRRNMYNGGWSGRGRSANWTYSTGTGQMHAAGVHCLTFLLLARQCGVEVDEHTLQASLQHFFRFAGRGNTPYGDGLPEEGFRDNGKTSGLALAMAAAAQLTPEGENSIYAQARDNAAMKSFYATSWFMQAHTGGGIGEIWHNMGMGLVQDSRPNQFRSFLDERLWSYELSRRPNGTFGIAGVDSRYDQSLGEDARAWGNYYALIYTLPRRQLRLFGAPRSQWSRTHPLPARPWGTAADDAFLSNTPVRPIINLDQETVPHDASYPVFQRIRAEGDTDRDILKYLCHPEYGFRHEAVGTMLRKKRYHMILPLLQSSDPRLRFAGVLAIAGAHGRSSLPADQVTPEMFDIAERMIRDPDESWWSTQHALDALARAEPERIARNIDRIKELLTHEEWWIRRSALLAAAQIFTTPPHHETLLPAMVRALTEARTAQMLNTARQVATRLANANPAVQAAAFSLFAEAYQDLPQDLIDPYNQHVFQGGSRAMRASMIDILFRLPGGIDIAKRAPKDTLASAISGNDEDLFVFDGNFQHNPTFAGRWRNISWINGDTLGGFNQRQLDRAFARIANRKRQRYVTLRDDGSVDRERFMFWTDDWLVNIAVGEAIQMRVVEVGDQQVLGIERSGMFTESQDPNFHPGYHIYVRE